ncbi:hypothetical protein BJ138DRAFT_992102, partial [Hygrophoropsis aurantiaca]
STLQNNSSSHQSLYRTPSNSSLSMHQNQSLLENADSYTKARTRLLQQKSSTGRSYDKKHGSGGKDLSSKTMLLSEKQCSTKSAPATNPSRFDNPILASSNSTSVPAKYQPNLTPAPSPLRPHCLARDRLRLWSPAPAPGRAVIANNLPRLPISEAQMERILDVVCASWA